MSAESSVVVVVGSVVVDENTTVAALACRAAWCDLADLWRRGATACFLATRVIAAAAFPPVVTSFWPACRAEACADIAPAIAIASAARARAIQTARDLTPIAFCIRYLLGVAPASRVDALISAHAG